MTERMTAGQYRATKKKRSKYGAKKVVVGGVTFDSKKEAARWVELNRLQAAGEIDFLQRQVKIVLQGRNGTIKTDSGKQDRTYVADFRYIDHRIGGVWVIEDSKGFETPEFKLKRAILEAQNISIKVT